MLTQQEKITLEKLSEIVQEYQKLQTYHPNDIKEFTRYIQAAQNIILAREAIRNNDVCFVCY